VSGSSVLPAGSNRMFGDVARKTSRGIPYCRPTEDATENASITRHTQNPACRSSGPFADPVVRVGPAGHVAPRSRQPSEPGDRCRNESACAHPASGPGAVVAADARRDRRAAAARATAGFCRRPLACAWPARQRLARPCIDSRLDSASAFFRASALKVNLTSTSSLVADSCRFARLMGRRPRHAAGRTPQIIPDVAHGAYRAFSHRAVEHLVVLEAAGRERRARLPCRRCAR